MGALAAADADALRKAAHKIKGACSYLHAQVAVDMAKVVETEARAVAELGTWTAAAKERLESLTASLRAEVDVVDTCRRALLHT